MNAVSRSESSRFTKLKACQLGKILKLGKVLATALVIFSFGINAAQAGPREQAKRIHDRIAGVPPSETVLQTMQDQITAGNATQAAFTAMLNPHFYDSTLKNWIMPWTNEEQTYFAPLNDYVATVIGIIRDGIDFREILSGDIIYVADPALTGIPAYANGNNDHYQALEDQHIDLKANLVQRTQSSVTGLPAEATAGVITTRAASKAFFVDGTNRAMFRFTLLNHMCVDLEQIMDNTRAFDRIRQDVSRSPGGDSRIFMNSCSGCHTGMDSLTGALAYYDYPYTGDFENGATSYNDVGAVDPDTGTRVKKKYRQNADNFKFGYPTVDDSWINYWRQGPNANLGWDPALPGSGNGAKSMGMELAHSEAFVDCQVEKVFQNVCLRPPVDAADRNQIVSMVASLKSHSYDLKQTFAESAVYCMGN